jgi:hypothetical protein
MDAIHALLVSILGLLSIGGGPERRPSNARQALVLIDEALMLLRERVLANRRDFAAAKESRIGSRVALEPPREDPEDNDRVRNAKIGLFFLVLLKMVLWALAGPVLLNLPMILAAIVAITISALLSFAVVPIGTDHIVQRQHTPMQADTSLTLHRRRGLALFLVSFGTLLLLRGLVGPLAMISVWLLLPVLSACELVLLHLMSVAGATRRHHGWARGVVRVESELLRLRSEVLGAREKALRDLGDSAEGGLVPTARIAVVAALLTLWWVQPAALAAPLQGGDAGNTAVVFLDIDRTSSVRSSSLDGIQADLTKQLVDWAIESRVEKIVVRMFGANGWLPAKLDDIPVWEHFRQSYSANSEMMSSPGQPAPMNSMAVAATIRCAVLAASTN